VALAADSLLGIINDILDTAKFDAGMLAMESIEFDLGEVLSRVGSLFQLKAMENGLELAIGCEPDVPELLIGDGYRLGQVLTNLVSNAIKFTDRGEVGLTVTLVECGAEQVTLHFQVRDTGVGMTPEQAAKLFKAFSQGDNSVTRKHGGTGLGLAISQQLVGRMHGQITLETRPGSGSCFRFNATFGRVVSGEARPKEGDTLSGSQVLVVEDNEISRTLHTLTITSFGCKVQAESSGEAALATLDRGARFDFVILDLNLPGMSGLETARAIHLQGNPTQIILITGDNPDLADASVASGQIQAVLPKPVRRAVLRETMRKLGEGQRSHAPTPELRPVATPDFSARRILLVDDNEFNREIGLSFIQATGAQVDSAENGEIAVRAVSQSHYDLILMDIQMPVMDGYAAAAILRSQWPDLAIVALTANAMVDERDRILAAGMQDILTKPFMPDVLYATISKWLPDASGQSSESGPARTQTEAVPANAQPDLTFAPVFDHATALRRVNGDQAVLDRFLRMFLAQTHRAMDLLASAVQAADFEVARRHAHSIKGGAGMVGLIELQLAAGSLETSLLQVLRGAGDAVVGRDELALLRLAWARVLAKLEPLPALANDIQGSDAP
jgi:CheY-like chemotaxis protein